MPCGSEEGPRSEKARCQPGRCSPLCRARQVLAEPPPSRDSACDKGCLLRESGFPGVGVRPPDRSQLPARPRPEARLVSRPYSRLMSRGKGESSDHVCLSWPPPGLGRSWKELPHRRPPRSTLRTEPVGEERNRAPKGPVAQNPPSGCPVRVQTPPSPQQGERLLWGPYRGHPASPRGHTPDSSSETSAICIGHISACRQPLGVSTSWSAPRLRLAPARVCR